MSIVAAKTAEFYQLLADAAVNPTTRNGVQSDLLNRFFNIKEIRERFTKAPASSAVRFHHAYDGGLVVHTLEMLRVSMIVADSLSFECRSTVVEGHTGWQLARGPLGFVKYSDLLAAAALHDLNKIGDIRGEAHYVANMIKNGTVRSDKIPYATNDALAQFDKLFPDLDSNPTSVSDALRQALHLACEAYEWVPDGVVSLSIVRAVSPTLYHGLSDDVKFAIVHHDGAYGKGRRRLTGNESPLQMILHFADMWSSRLQEESFRA